MTARNVFLTTALPAAKFAEEGRAHQLARLAKPMRRQGCQVRAHHRDVG
jgi:hypothetical protein